MSVPNVEKSAGIYQKRVNLLGFRWGSKFARTKSTWGFRVSPLKKILNQTKSEKLDSALISLSTKSMFAENIRHCNIYIYNILIQYIPNSVSFRLQVCTSSHEPTNSAPINRQTCLHQGHFEAAPQSTFHPPKKATTLVSIYIYI